MPAKKNKNNNCSSQRKAKSNAKTTELEASSVSKVSKVSTPLCPLESHERRETSFSARQWKNKTSRNPIDCPLRTKTYKAAESENAYNYFDRLSLSVMRMIIEDGFTLVKELPGSSLPDKNQDTSAKKQKSEELQKELIQSAGEIFDLSDPAMMYDVKKVAANIADLCPSLSLLIGKEKSKWDMTDREQGLLPFLRSQETGNVAVDLYNYNVTDLQVKAIMRMSQLQLLYPIRDYAAELIRATQDRAKFCINYIMMPPTKTETTMESHDNSSTETKTEVGIYSSDSSESKNNKFDDTSLEKTNKNNNNKTNTSFEGISTNDTEETGQDVTDETKHNEYEELEVTITMYDLDMFDQNKATLQSLETSQTHGSFETLETCERVTMPDLVFDAVKMSYERAVDTALYNLIIAYRLTNEFEFVRHFFVLWKFDKVAAMVWTLKESTRLTFDCLSLRNEFHTKSLDLLNFMQKLFEDNEEIAIKLVVHRAAFLYKEFVKKNSNELGQVFFLLELLQMFPVSVWETVVDAFLELPEIRELGRPLQEILLDVSYEHFDLDYFVALRERVSHDKFLRSEQKNFGKENNSRDIVQTILNIVG